MKETKTTIYFSTKLCQEKTHAYVSVPKNSKLPKEQEIKVEGVINGFPFRSTIEDLNLEVSKTMLTASKSKIGESVSVEITYVDDETETRIPIELSKLLKSNQQALQVWNDTTQIARGDWVLWIASAKKAETRLIRIEKAISMLSSGKKRICCFGGRNWLIKSN